MAASGANLSLLCAVLTLSCYAPMLPVGLACTGAGECPTGQSCDPVALLCTDNPGEACRAPDVACEGACVDSSSDAQHCGMCGNACTPDEVCGGSECVSQCPEQTPTDCGGSCVDLQAARVHCGQCGKACDSDESCIAGQCTVGEIGTVTVDQSDDQTWHTVTLAGAYGLPVVIMGPPSSNEAEPTTVRVRNVTTSSFEFQLEEWDYLDASNVPTGLHAQETLAYLVVEAGTHQLDNGSTLQAGFTTANELDATVTFPAAFAAPPIVLSQITSTRNALALTPRNSGATEGDFVVHLRAEDAVTQTMPVFEAEDLGWIAIEAFQGSWSGLVCETFQGDCVSSGVSDTEPTPAAITFVGSFAAEPAILAKVQTLAGGDTMSLRSDNRSTTAVDIRCREELSFDVEINHNTETIAGLACAPGVLLAAP